LCVAENWRRKDYRIRHCAGETIPAETHRSCGNTS
jgi:hypothetical protein